MFFFNRTFLGTSIVAISGQDIDGLTGVVEINVRRWQQKYAFLAGIKKNRTHTASPQVVECCHLRLDDGRPAPHGCPKVTLDKGAIFSPVSMSSWFLPSSPHCATEDLYALFGKGGKFVKKKVR